MLRAWGVESPGPAAVGFDDFVDLGHQADGFAEGEDDLVVVGDVFVVQGAAFAVFEPFLADLVAADVEVPDGFGHTLETAAAGGLERSFLGGRGVEPDCVGRPANAGDFLGPADELGDGLVVRRQLYLPPDDN